MVRAPLARFLRNSALNRSGTNWTYDNLNRMTVSPDTSGTHVYEHDAAGNRTWRDRTNNKTNRCRQVGVLNSMGDHSLGGIVEPRQRRANERQP